MRSVVRCIGSHSAALRSGLELPTCTPPIHFQDPTPLKLTRRPLSQLTSAQPHMPTVRSTPTRRCISILHPPRPPTRPAGSVSSTSIQKLLAPWYRSHGTATSSSRSSLLMPQQPDALQQPDAAATTCCNEASACSAGLWAHAATTPAHCGRPRPANAQQGVVDPQADLGRTAAAYATLGRWPYVRALYEQSSWQARI